MIKRFIVPIAFADKKEEHHHLPVEAEDAFLADKKAAEFEGAEVVGAAREITHEGIWQAFNKSWEKVEQSRGLKEVHGNK